MSPRTWMVFWLVGIAGLWGLAWAIGMAIQWPWVFAIAAAGLVARWAGDQLVDPLRVLWPEPARPLAQRWFGIDPLVRRLAHEVQTASQDGRGADEIRERLRIETGRRLVERHGADPADPVAAAPELLGDQWRLLASTKRMSTDQLSALTRRIEEL